MTDPEDAATAGGAVLTDRRRPGRRGAVSAELIALLRRPGEGERARIEAVIEAHDARPPPLAGRPDGGGDLPTLLAVVVGAAFCAGVWLGVLRLAVGS